jgi:hypothetical protein
MTCSMSLLRYCRTDDSRTLFDLILEGRQVFAGMYAPYPDAAPGPYCDTGTEWVIHQRFANRQAHAHAC